MKTMNTIAVVKWLVGREEIPLAERISYLFSGSTVVDTEKLESLFYLTLGSNLGPSLFKEMQCEVTTLLTLETE